MQKVTVVVQDGAEPFGLGSLVEVWGESYHPEDDNPVFDFKVCTPRPGRVRGPFRLRHVRRARTRGDGGRRPGLPEPQARLPRPRPAGAGGRARGVRPGRDHLRPLLRRLRARRGRAARRPRLHDPLALQRPTGGEVPRGEGLPRRPLLPGRHHPHRCRVGRRHRRIAPPDARSTSAPGRPRRPPAGSSYRRTAPAARRSSSPAPSPTATPRRSARCSPGSPRTSATTCPSRSWRGAATCRRARSPAASATRPAPPRTAG